MSDLQWFRTPGHNWIAGPYLVRRVEDGLRGWSVWCESELVAHQVSERQARAAAIAHATHRRSDDHGAAPSRDDE